MEKNEYWKDYWEKYEVLLRKILDNLQSLYEEHQRLNYIRSQLINFYLQTVDEVKKSKKISKEEKLKRLIILPILLNNPSLTVSIPFIDESIWIDRELDLENLNYDKNSYMTLVLHLCS